MFLSLTRTLSSRSSYATVAIRVFSHKVSQVREKPPDEQIEYIKSITDNNIQNWTAIRSEVLSKTGNINEKNIDAIILKFTTSLKNFDAALSFAQHLKGSSNELSLGTINGILGLYYEMGKINKLSKDQKQFILDTYKSLYDKYKVLDYTTSEKLLHALCTINEWEKALKVLDDIHLSSKPSHSAYSTLIATFFTLNKKKKALLLIDESIKHKRPLQDNAYDEWLNHILRKYKDKKIIAKHMDEVFNHVAQNYATVPLNTANKLKEIYSSLDWNAQFTRIKKVDGQCSCCKDKLECLSLSDEAFSLLQQNVKEKLIVGSDLFLKTSPKELSRFLNFVQKTAPYDVVLDALNVAYAIGMAPHREKLIRLNFVVDYFVKQNKKVLLLGRKHMLTWHKNTLDMIASKTYSFYTDDISQDDPYFITAAILSGSHTDIVSKDLLRGHTFQFKEESLRHMFKRWQWQHQWMVFLNANKTLTIQPPLKFTPCAQKKDNTWHLPFNNQIVGNNSPAINDGTPDLYSWLCLRQT